MILVMKGEPVTSYPPKGRLIAAFMCAPLASALAFACFEPLYAGLPNYIDRVFRTFLWYFLIGGLPTAAVVGIPVFLMLRRRLHPTALNCILAGGVVAAIPWLILLVLPNGTNYSFDDGHVTILNGHRTAWGWIYGGQSVLQVAAFGLIGGLTFWVVATFRLHDRKSEVVPRRAMGEVSMLNTLGLDDDLDPVEAVLSLEKAFALKISDDEASSCNTVGDIYDLLHSRFATQIGEPGSCMTSMAFYRLRRSLRGMHPGIEFRPDTPLAICAGWNTRAFLGRLRSDSGLQLPGPQGQWLSGAGCILLLLAIVGAVVVAVTKGPPIFYLAAVALFVVGGVLIRLDPGALSQDCATLGGLATKASALNYGTFARSGGAIRPKELWDAMADVLSGFSELPKSDMRRDTLILHQKV